MKRRIRLGDLKRIISESLLFEDEGAPTAEPKEDGDSLDSQVDRYLTQYEGSAKTSKKEGRDFRMMTRRILGEAGDDDEADADKDAGAGDEAGATEPSKLTMDDIDMESFTNDLVRLIDNYDSLLEVRSTLAKRGINFIAKAYAPDVVEELKRVLREEHGLVPGESEMDVAAEDFPAPAADRAGDGGAGGAPA